MLGAHLVHMKQVLLAFALLFLCSPWTCQAKDVVFVFEVYPPYEYREGTALVGTDVDFIQEVWRRLSLRPVFRELPWSRALAEVKSGKVDAIFSLVKTPEREQFLFFPEEYLSFEQFIFLARRDNPITISTPSDFKGKRVGVCTGYSYDPFFDADASFDREEALNDEQQLRKLAGGRMELAIMNRQVFHYTARRLGMTGLFQVMPYELEGKHYMYVAFSRARGLSGQTLADQFSLTLKALQREGVLQEILKKYN